MSIAEPNPLGPEVVVAEDGSAPSVPADVLARYGFRPGMHLRLVPEVEEVRQPPRKKLKGALVGKINVEAFEAGMAWGEADRIAQVEGLDEDNA